jgi:hypothetical protein
LQWGDDAEDKRRAGDLLKKLGNKKSVFIIQAISEYIDAHLPEYVAGQLNTSQTGKPKAAAVQKKDKPIYEEKRRGARPLTGGLTDGGIEQAVPDDKAYVPETQADEADIDIMLDNLSLF